MESADEPRKPSNGDAGHGLEGHSPLMPICHATPVTLIPGTQCGLDDVVPSIRAEALVGLSVVQSTPAIMWMRCRTRSAMVRLRQQMPWILWIIKILNSESEMWILIPWIKKNLNFKSEPWIYMEIWKIRGVRRTGPPIQLGDPIDIETTNLRCNFVRRSRKNTNIAWK